MDFRKIIAFGKSSFVVSLPKDWLQNNKLVKGDVVFLEQDSDKLIIVPKEKELVKEEKRILIKTRNKDISRVKREIASAFINFHDYIVIEGDNLPTMSKEISEFIHHLVALEIMEQSSTKIIAKDFLKVGDVTIKDYVRKSDITIRSILMDLKDPNYAFYDATALRQKSVDRIYLLVFKAIKSMHETPTTIKKSGITSSEMIKYNQYNYCLYRVGKYLKHIALSMNKLKKKEIKIVSDLVGELYDHYISVMKAVHNQDNEKSYLLSNKKGQVRSKLDSIIDKSNGKLVLVVYLISMIYLEIHELNHANYD